MHIIELLGLFGQNPKTVHVHPNPDKLAFFICSSLLSLILSNRCLLSSEEAENERMHLMTALELKNPGMLFKGLVIVSQGM